MIHGITRKESNPDFACLEMVDHQYGSIMTYGLFWIKMFI